VTSCLHPVKVEEVAEVLVGPHGGGCCPGALKAAGERAGPAPCSSHSTTYYLLLGLLNQPGQAAAGLLHLLLELA